MGWKIRSAAALVLAFAAAASPVRAGDTPRSGLDEIRLVDGRVFRCPAVEETESVVRLRYSGGTVEIPRASVDEVRLFRDFDPEPRTDEERALAAKGLVRWAGKWITPAQMATLNRRAEKAAEAAFEANEAHLDWDNRWKRKTRHFVIEANLRKDTLDRYEALLEGFYDYFTSAFKVAAKNPIRVLLFRTRQEFDDFRKVDAKSTGEFTVGYFVPRPGEERLVLFHDEADRAESESTLLHEATHLMLYLARPDVGLPPWANEGLAEYYSGFLCEKGKFTTGRVQEGRLLALLDMVEGDGLVHLKDLLLTGHPDPAVRDQDFGLPHYAQSWLLVHYLMAGEKGKFRGRFSSYLNGHLTLQAKRGVPGSSKSYMVMPFEDDLESFRSSMKVREWDDLKNSLEEYLRTLPLDSAWAFLARARRTMKTGRDPASVDSDLEEAFRRGRDDAEFLLRMLRATAVMEGQEDRRRAISARLRELDPLDAGIRIALAPSLDPEARDGEMLLALEIDPHHRDAGTARAWLAHRGRDPLGPVAIAPEELPAAREAFEAAAAAAKPGPESDRSLAESALRARLRDPALSMARRAAAAAPADPEMHLLVARCAAASGATKDAVAALRAYDRAMSALLTTTENRTPTRDRKWRYMDRALLECVEACWTTDRPLEAMQVLLETYASGLHLPYGEGAMVLFVAAALRAGPAPFALQMAERGTETFPSSRLLDELLQEALQQE